MSWKLMKNIFNIKKSIDISGTWTIQGNILQSNSIIESIEKTVYENYNDEFIIVQDKTNPDIFFVNSLNIRSYHPGIIKSYNPIRIMITNINDNGVYELKETKRDNSGLITNMIGIYYESGYSDNNILQVPTVGKISFQKKSNSTSIKPLISQPQMNFAPITLTNFQCIYYIQNFYETITKNNNNYIINITSPLLGNNNKIIGYMNSVNKYTILQGNSYCEAITNYYFFNKIHNDDYNNYHKKNKYIKPDSIEITSELYVNFNYYGTISNNKYMSGNLLVKATDKNNTDITINLKGNTNGLCILTSTYLNGKISTE